MKTVKNALFAGLVGTAILAPVAIASASTIERIIPQSASSSRAYALYASSDDQLPMKPTCSVTRMQVPTSEGLRWVAKENCAARD